MIVGLALIMLAVLVLPFSVRRVEHNLEVFLLVMGLAAAVVGGVLDRALATHALVEPLPISGAVLVAGAVFKLARRQLQRLLHWMLVFVPARALVFMVVLVLGLASSVITAIIASLILVEVVSALPLERKGELWMTVMACYAIGLGAALTPLGEPLATIVVAALDQDFWYLARLLWWLVVPGVVIFAGLAALVPVHTSTDSLAADEEEERWSAVAVRAGKVFVFVAALVFLGHGFKPVVDAYIVKLPGAGLYWINMVSAILDNATLAAAEISPTMSVEQQRDVLMGLLIAGGMLIPGNIPNIISAAKLRITSREWAKSGVGVGLAAMAVCFVILLFV